MSLTPSSSWQSEGLRHTLSLGTLVANVEPNADKSGWVWEIRGTRSRRNASAPIVRGWDRCDHHDLAKLEAEAALRVMAEGITRIVGTEAT